MCSFTPHRRRCRTRSRLTTALAAALGIMVGASALAQKPGDDFPTRPVKLIVPFPPGGAADIFARFISERLSKTWSQPMIVENRPGAGGIIATQAAAKSPADGHTLLIVTTGHAINLHLYDTLPYDTKKDFTPVALVASMPNTLIVNNAVPAHTLGELIDLAQRQPAKLTYGSAGNATTSHVAAALLTNLAQIDMLHVPYRGSAPAFAGLIGGQIDMLIDPVISAAQQARQGRVRALAVTTTRRSALMPELPTMQEAGVPGYDFAAWFILLAPAATPAAIVQKLNRDIEQLMAQPETEARYLTLGAETGHGAPEQLRAFLAAEMARYAKMVRETGMKAQ